MADEVQRVLRKLQAEARSNSAPDDLDHATWNLPEDLATKDCKSIWLDGAGLRAKENARVEILKDQRFEYLDGRKLDDLLWRFIHACFRDRSHDKVRAFIDEQARAVQEATCYLPVDHLTVAIPQQIQGARFLPLGSEEIPSPGPWFVLDKPVGSVIAVPVRGTNHGLMASRARATAEHALRVLRVALKLSNPSILDRQLRFRVARTWAFADDVSGFALRQDGVYGFGLGDNVLEAQAVIGLPEGPRNNLERQAVLAVQWINRGIFASEPVLALLYHFFALEALLGEKSEGLKAPLIARRRAMLAAAMDAGFLHPHANYFFYDRVRSAAVHGEIPDEVTEETVRTFTWDVQTALQEFLGYAKKEGFTKKSDLVKALDNHPKHAELLDWLQESGGPLWDKHFEKLDAKPHLSSGLSGAIRQLGYWIGTGTVGYPLLEGVDWLPVAHSEPSLLEAALAVWANNLWT